MIYPATGIHKIKNDAQGRFYIPRHMKKLIDINNFKYDIERFTIGAEGKEIKKNRITIHRDFRETYKFLIGDGHSFKLTDEKPVENFTYSNPYPFPKGRHCYLGSNVIKINDNFGGQLPSEVCKRIEANLEDELKGIYMAYAPGKNKFVITETPLIQFPAFEFMPISERNFTIPTRFQEYFKKGDYSVRGVFNYLTLRKGVYEFNREAVVSALGVLRRKKSS